jgi:predicted  nucleic acid-binding Zn-ribbon protein
MIKRIIPIMIIIFLAELSFGEVYKWLDEKGIVHFTDDITQVPKKYQQAIEEIGIEEEQGEIKTEGESSPKKKEDAKQDRLGRGEEYWKARVEELKGKIQGLQGETESLRMKYNELTEKFNSSKSSVQRTTLRNEREKIKSQMDQKKIQIAEVKEMLEKKIPEEAQLYGANPEWIKP